LLTAPRFPDIHWPAGFEPAKADLFAPRVYLQWKTALLVGPPQWPPFAKSSKFSITAWREERAQKALACAAASCRADVMLVLKVVPVTE